jgi:regulator of protease activity HflC (stomatin/prohibitin superfamily)
VLEPEKPFGIQPAPQEQKVIGMKRNSSFAALIFIVILGIGGVFAYIMYRASAGIEALGVLGCALILASFVSSGIQVADQWSKAVVLRLGKFRSLQGPGLFLIIPVIDSIPYWIDTRVLTSSFKAEKTLTKDTVPVDVDAVLFWKIVDPKKAALDVADYQSAISWASQTALRDVIGKTMLSDMLEGRDKISDVLRKIIDERTEPWGINVISVEVKDVLIPAALEDAMSMQAQAERERQARVILGDSERQVAEKFEEAAKSYTNNPVALHLRAMNMLYEGLKANSTIVIVPSSAVETMQLGGLAGLTALTMGLGQEQAKKGRDSELKISSTLTPTPENELNPVLRAEAMAANPNAIENGSLIKTLR